MSFLHIVDIFFQNWTRSNWFRNDLLIDFIGSLQKLLSDYRVPCCDIWLCSAALKSIIDSLVLLMTMCSKSSLPSVHWYWEMSLVWYRYGRYRACFFGHWFIITIPYLVEIFTGGWLDVRMDVIGDLIIFAQVNFPFTTWILFSWQRTTTISPHITSVLL